MALKVVLIEDNRDHIYLIRTMLEEYEEIGDVVVYEDAEGALESLFRADDNNQKSMPDLILLDLKLPRMSGLDFLAQIRQSSEGEHMPVFVLTSSDRLEERTRSDALGVMSYIVKPLTDESVENIINKIRSQAPDSLTSGLK